MALVSWMYVSRSQLSPVRKEEELKRIVAVGRTRNREQDMTGALLFTGARFAQYLEGPRDHMTELQGLIRQDPRHADIVTIDERPRGKRYFGERSLVFIGSTSHYVATTVERPLLHPEGRREGVEALRRLMIEFAGQAPGSAVP